MDVNSINNSVTNLNPSSQTHLDKAHEASKTEQPQKDEALNLSISDIYNKKRDELSKTFQSLNEGLAINEISKRGLEKQAELIKNVEDTLYNAKESKDFEENKNDLKAELVDELNKFNEIADTTTYKNEKLLTVDKKEDNNILTVSTKDQVFTLNKPETKEISSSLAQNFKENSFSSENDIDSALYETASANNKLNELIDNFNNTEEKIERSARDTISEQIQLSKENSSLRDIDFGAETSDFSKTNVNSQLGFLVGSQANIVQDQSVRLLSK